MKDKMITFEEGSEEPPCCKDARFDGEICPTHGNSSAPAPLCECGDDFESHGRTDGMCFSCPCPGFRPAPGEAKRRFNPQCVMRTGCTTHERCNTAGYCTLQPTPAQSMSAADRAADLVNYFRGMTLGPAECNTLEQAAINHIEQHAAERDALRAEVESKDAQLSTLRQERAREVEAAYVEGWVSRNMMKRGEQGSAAEHWRKSKALAALKPEVKP